MTYSSLQENDSSQSSKSITIFDSMESFHHKLQNRNEEETKSNKKRAQCKIKMKKVHKNYGNSIETIIKVVVSTYPNKVKKSTYVQSERLAQYSAIKPRRRIKRTFSLYSFRFFFYFLEIRSRKQNNTEFFYFPHIVIIILYFYYILFLLKLLDEFI